MKIGLLFSLYPLAEGDDFNEETLHSNMKYWKYQLEFFWLVMERPFDYNSFLGIKSVSINEEGNTTKYCPKQLNSLKQLNSAKQLNNQEQRNIKREHGYLGINRLLPI